MITTAMRTYILPLVALFALLLPARYCAAQKISLVEKQYHYYNMGTGGGTSDRSFSFRVEGENKTQKAGYFGQHLRKYISSDSTGDRYMRVFATRQTIRLTTTVLTLASFTAFAIPNLSKEAVSTENLDKPARNRGFMYLTGASALATGILAMVRPKSIIRAVEAYNGEPLINSPLSTSVGLSVQDGPGTPVAGVGLTVRF